MTVSRRLRFEILRRDGHTCRYCGGVAPDVVLTVDHVVPVALGGGDDPSNLVTACRDCNAGKSSIAPDAPIVEDVSAAADAFRRALSVAWEHDVDEDDPMHEYYVLALDDWPPGEWRDDEWVKSVAAWTRLGAVYEDFSEMIAVTFRERREDPWRYFCGCMWRVCDRRVGIAADLVERGVVV